MPLSSERTAKGLGKMDEKTALLWCGPNYFFFSHIQEYKYSPFYKKTWIQTGTFSTRFELPFALSSF